MSGINLVVCRGGVCHQLLKTPDAEDVARGEASACRILFIEERDRKLDTI